MAHNSQARIAAHVHPNARRSEVVGFTDGVLRVRIAAPPINGRANRELISLLSDLLGIARSSLSIEKGATSRNKTIAVNGLGQQQVAGLLATHMTTR